MILIHKNILEENTIRYKIHDSLKWLVKMWFNNDIEKYSNERFLKFA